MDDLWHRASVGWSVNLWRGIRRVGCSNYSSPLGKRRNSVRRLVVPVRVVHIGHVRMRMSHWAMLVRMCVWFARRILSLMGVTVMDVMHVRMRMHEGLVDVFVLVMLCEVQP